MNDYAQVCPLLLTCALLDMCTATRTIPMLYPNVNLLLELFNMRACFSSSCEPQNQMKFHLPGLSIWLHDSRLP